MTRESILEVLCLRFDLSKDDITYSINLFTGQIDSLDFLEYAKIIGTIAKTENLPFDIKDFLYSECYSIDEIYTYLTKTL